MLFICSSAIDRAPTAADLFKNSKAYAAKAAGTHGDSRVLLTQTLVDWATIIFVMSEGTNGHLTYLRKNFKTYRKPIHDLHIRDIYFRNDPRLVRALAKRISRILPNL